MTSDSENKHKLRILCIGLEPEEYRVIASVSLKHKAVLEIATSELELTERARECDFDLYVLGQTDYMPDTNYLIWLLKDYAEHSRFVLIYSELPPDRVQSLEEFKAYSIIHRPVSNAQLQETFDDTILGYHDVYERIVEEVEHFWHALGSLFHKD